VHPELMQTGPKKKKKKKKYTITYTEAIHLFFSDDNG
jgi:hypothetical protein